MKFPVRMLLLLNLFFITGPVPVSAQDEEEVEEFDDFDELYLGQLLDVVYTAAKHEQDIGMSPSAVTVLTREDIEASGATTIADALRIVPGFEVILATPYFYSTTSRLYYTHTNNHHLVLIDGREANLELLGFPPWTLNPIQLEEIERIEVIRGPGSFLYGANATGGVVSITTRPIAKQPAGEFYLGMGESGALTVYARGSARLGGWGFSLSAGADPAGQFADPRALGRRTWRIRGLAEYCFSRTRRLVIDAGIVDGRGPVSTGVGTLDNSLGIQALRVAYESEDLRGQLYYTHNPLSVDVSAPNEYSGIRLASFVPAEGHGHIFDTQLDWTLPKFLDSLNIILGGGGRAAYWGSDQFLDDETYADITSPRYHQEGVDHWEWRAAGFAQLEYAPAEWVTMTGGVRFDYNSETGEFISPRGAAVFQPHLGQFVRLGVARAFRKPPFLETGTHLMVDFPADSPITGPAQEKFQEFMTRVAGNPALKNEDLWSFETGYLGRFFDGRLSVSLDLYFNLVLNRIEFNPQIESDAQGLPDLDNSTATYDNVGKDLDIFGSELAFRYNPSSKLSFLLSWVHREVFIHGEDSTRDQSPKNLITLGGRFRSDLGLVGSLYVFSRSEFWDRAIENPGGFLEPYLPMHMHNVFLFMGRLGWRMKFDQVELETGFKLFLPFSPFRDPLFRYYEKGGLLTRSGGSWSGVILARMLTGYVKGSF